MIQQRIGHHILAALFFFYLQYKDWKVFQSYLVFNRPTTNLCVSDDSNLIIKVQNSSERGTFSLISANMQYGDHFHAANQTERLSSLVFNRPTTNLCVSVD